MQQKITDDVKPNMFLDSSEIVELTGRRRKDCQVKALRHMGVEHRIRPDGTVAVLREHVVREFAGNIPMAKVKRSREPNWSALNA